MALTKIITDGITDDAVTEAKLANAINTAVAANTAKDLTALSASDLTSGTVPDARFPATLPAASAANLTSIPAGNITGTLPAISATNLTNIPAANITGTLPAISGANLTGISSAGKAHNLVINGAMQVAQRGTSSAGGEGYKTVDRFQYYKSGTNETPNQAQVDVAAGTPAYQAGFRKAYQIENGNQSSAGGSDLVFIETKIESQDIANSGWDYTSTSSYITLSFWVKSSQAQNFYGYLLTKDGPDRTYPFETGSLSANTWTKVTKTIPGNSILQFDNDNGPGLHIVWWPFLGDGYTDNSVSLNTWGSYDGSNRTPDSTNSWYLINDATFEITGVQLEVGDSATDFEHRSYAQELALCQRYFYKHDIQSSTGPYFTQYHSGHKFVHDFFPVTMRTTPTASVSISSNSDGNNPYHLSPNHYKSYIGSSYTDGNTHFISAASYDAEL